MRCWSPLLALFLANAALAKHSPRWDDPVVKHKWAVVPRGWISQGAAPANHVMTFQIGLKQDKLDSLIHALHEVSDPNHFRYGQHLSKQEVDALVAPHPDTTETVEAWLAHHDIAAESIHRTDAGDWVTITLSVEQAERMFGAKYEMFAHPDSAESVVRTVGYSLPRELHDHINVVTPTTYFGTMRSMRATSKVLLQPAAKVVDDGSRIAIRPGSDATVPSSCSSDINPACLRGLYNTTSYVPKSTATNKLGVAGYLGEYANDEDFQTFAKKYRTDAVGTTFQHVQVNGGGNNQTDPGMEANLDIQYTIGMSYPTPNIYYSTGGSPPFIPDDAVPSNTNEPYLNWLNYILKQKTIPQTISTSYGDDEQTVPHDYAVSVCNLFAVLGARGTTAFFSSGDSGVGSDTCETNDGKNTVKFQPYFPASCPYVTTVGGTFQIPEVAVPFSGGGFSNYFAQPPWQTAVVSKYLMAFGSAYSTYYNKSGRAYPDLAAQSLAFHVIIGGIDEPLVGTSASAPTVAGIFSLVNDYRLSLGKPPLGWLNPLLYSNLFTAFNDITNGSNPGCNTDGFSSKAGWDPVTGFGTPDFVKIQAIVKNI